MKLGSLVQTAAAAIGVGLAMAPPADAIIRPALFHDRIDPIAQPHPQLLPRHGSAAELPRANRHLVQHLFRRHFTGGAVPRLLHRVGSLMLEGGGPARPN
jgi:hypothetical protein